MQRTKKVFLCLFIAAMLLATVACTTTPSTNSEATTPAPTTTADTSVPDSSKVSYSDQETLEISYISANPLNEDNYLKKMLKEKYNIEFTSIGNYTAANTEIPLLIASNDYPEWIYSDTYSVYYPLAYDGYFINWKDYLDRLPNYRALFTDEQWETDIPAQYYPDGNLYFLPQYRAWTASMGWLVRQDLLEANGLETPKTLDDIMTLCTEWKKIYPDSLPIADKWEQCWQGVRYALGSYPNVNVKTGEYQAFYQAQDEYREALKYFYNLYKTGYIDQEFITVSNAQFEERFATSNPCIAFGAVAWESNFNNYTKAGTGELNKNPNWRAVEHVISNDPECKIYPRNASAQNWGCFFTDKILEQEGLLDRMLDFLDWTCTEEGQTWQTFGEEGETFTYDSTRTPQYIETAIDPLGSRKDGKPTKNDLGLTSITSWNADAITSMYGNDAWKRYGDAIATDPNAYGIITKLALTIPEDLSKRKGELQTELAAVTDEYMNKFRTCVLDPHSDNDWNEYIQKLENTGLAEYKTMLEKLYNEQYGK